MSAEKILVTGGAGFIGQHLCRSLLHAGFEITVLDNFQAQVHGNDGHLSKDLQTAVELVRGDIRDRDVLSAALRGISVIVHLAADTGTGQSMYEIERYFSVNIQGTAALIAALQNLPNSESIRSIVVASSRAVYGEGAYLCANHGVVYPDARAESDLVQGKYEPRCPICQVNIETQATPESAPFKPMSIYGLTKQVQEQAVLMYARIKGINGVALRYQNVFGPGQSLRNPYTGILAVFSNLARQSQIIELYEDGLESRDFVYIDDIVSATLRAVNMRTHFCGALNVGSGVATTVETVASEINRHFGTKSKIQVTGAFRVGDIRHNTALIDSANAILGFQPSVTFQTGIDRFLAWAETQEVGNRSAYAMSVAELTSKGLMRHRGR